MKVTFEREVLGRVLDVVERVLPTKAAAPLYQPVYLGVLSKKEVEIKVTNGDQFLSIRMNAKVTDGKKGDGVALPGEEFLRMVKVAPAAEVSLTTGSDKAQIASGGAQWVLRYLVGVSWSDAPEGHPEAPESESEIPAGLGTAIRKVQYAVARTQNRPSWRQVLVADGQVVAADGRRCHVMGVGELNGGHYLIPEQVLDVVLDLLGLIGDEEAVIEAGDEWIGIRSEKVTFVSGRLVYAFPDVLGVMVKKGKAQKIKLSVPRQMLATAVVVASTAEDEGMVLLSVEGGKMRVESESSQMKAQMGFEVESNLTEKWEKWFTADLLKEMLGSFSGETIEFRISEGDESRLYVEDGAECAVLMPLSR